MDNYKQHTRPLSDEPKSEHPASVVNLRGVGVLRSQRYLWVLEVLLEAFEIAGIVCD